MLTQEVVSFCFYKATAVNEINVERPPVPFFRLNVGTGDRNKLFCTLKPRYGALHTRFNDYTPRNESYRGLIDYY